MKLETLLSGRFMNSVKDGKLNVASSWRWGNYSEVGDLSEARPCGHVPGLLRWEEHACVE